MGLGGSVVLAVREPGGRAERLIHELDRTLVRWHGARPIVDNRRRRDYGEGCVVARDVTEDEVEAALGGIDPDWRDDLEIVNLDHDVVQDLLTP
jgi:hypothetical protein